MRLEEMRPTMAAADTPAPAAAANSACRKLPQTPNSERLLAALNLAAMCLPWLWVCGAPLSFALTTAGLLGAERLRRQSRPLEDARITEMCRQLAASLKISYRVGVAICDRIAAPILVGIFRPMILLPAAALAGWDPQQLEMVLLHELAHVRRYDNLVNLLQRIVESLLFFQPMVWIISGWVRREREHCCDELVVARTRQPHAYAEMLVTLAETILSKRAAQLVACASPSGFVHGRAAAGRPHSPHSEEGGTVHASLPQGGRFGVHVLYCPCNDDRRVLLPAESPEESLAPPKPPQNSKQTESKSVVQSGLNGETVAKQQGKPTEGVGHAADLKALQGPWKVVPGPLEKGRDADSFWSSVFRQKVNLSAVDRVNFVDRKLEAKRSFNFLSIGDAMNFGLAYTIDPETATKTIDLSYFAPGRMVAWASMSWMAIA